MDESPVFQAAAGHQFESPRVYRPGLKDMEDCHTVLYSTIHTNNRCLV